MQRIGNGPLLGCSFRRLCLHNATIGKAINRRKLQRITLLSRVLRFWSNFGPKMTLLFIGSFDGVHIREYLCSNKIFLAQVIPEIFNFFHSRYFPSLLAWSAPLIISNCWCCRCTDCTTFIKNCILGLDAMEKCLVVMI